MVMLAWPDGSDSGYIVKVEWIGFPEGLDVECERKRKDYCKAFDLSVCCNVLQIAVGG